PKIADEDEGEEKKDDKKNGRPATDASKRQGNQRRGGSGGTGRPAPPPVEVTFTTDVPDAEIFLNASGRQQSLGRTDSEGRLTTRLARGTHQVIASRIGYRIQRQQIDVRPDNNSFRINLSLPTPPPKPEATPEPTADATPTPEPADTTPPSEKVLNDAAELTRRYLDPRETAGVTEAEWTALLGLVGSARSKEPDNPQLNALALLAEGQVAYLKQDFASALVAFNKAVRAQPDLVAAHYGRGNAYLATNQPVEAFKAYQRATELNKDLALAYKGQGDALSKQNKTGEAAKFYSRAQALGGSSSSSSGSTSPAPSVIGYEAARNLKRQKRWAQALREFQQLAETQPTADLYIDIGDSYLGLEQPLSASQAYRKATELDPRAALAHYKFGEVMFNLREWAASAEALERALALDLTGATVNRKRAREMANKAAEQVRKLSK
ncbi:MAG TPA: tetratricopeptide repeat protein, partial [Pyrinomonadaceae bacterium]|nr:tetratricopeptide repeat protein [Pyrinomonadaceae bacterium]